MIWTGFAPTGDGIAASLLVAEALAGRPLAEAIPMTKLPQTLVNVEVADRDAVEDAAGLWAEVEREGAALEGSRARAGPPVGHRAARARDGRGARAGRVRGEVAERLVAAVQRELG